MITTTFSPLHRADGSASFTSNGCTAIAAINGPIEVQRRDELPEEAVVDVAIRPASGVGGIRERHLETIIRNTLRQVILVSAHPRTLIQVTLQIAAVEGSTQESELSPLLAYNLFMLPVLLQASSLALLSTSIPLITTLTATLVAMDLNERLFGDPSPQVLQRVSSLHFFAFSSNGDMLSVESEGDFSIESWEAASKLALQRCNGQESDESETDGMDVDSTTGDDIQAVLKSAVQKKITKDLKWKRDLDG